MHCLDLYVHFISRGSQDSTENRRWILTNTCQHPRSVGRSRAASLALAGCVMPQDFSGFVHNRVDGWRFVQHTKPDWTVGGRSKQSNRSEAKTTSHQRSPDSDTNNKGNREHDGGEREGGSGSGSGGDEEKRKEKEKKEGKKNNQTHTSS